MYSSFFDFQSLNHFFSLQCQRNASKANIPSVEDDQTDEEHRSGEEEDDDFIPTQR